MGNAQNGGGGGYFGNFRGLKGKMAFPGGDPTFSITKVTFSVRDPKNPQKRSNTAQIGGFPTFFKREGGGGGGGGGGTPENRENPKNPKKGGEGGCHQFPDLDHERS